MSDRVEITCPRCGTSWWVDPTQLGGPVQILYKELERGGRVESYRLRCPTCGTYFVVDLEFSEEGDG